MHVCECACVGGIACMGIHKREKERACSHPDSQGQIHEEKSRSARNSKLTKEKVYNSIKERDRKFQSVNLHKSPCKNNLTQDSDHRISTKTLNKAGEATLW